MKTRNRFVAGMVVALACSGLGAAPLENARVVLKQPKLKLRDMYAGFIWEARLAEILASLERD